ncbi:LacI family DNA-binding transcriptional regulator [Thalassotalea marina]|uniref:DNA-binding transcriptional regulator CytR n=1 Tax=Thalassotalea marina TaxID=1673741 RepID=A0A919BPE0_9GAMM|nr:LacI family DNA-binding transcriptional regulator [Thalassotalea marina]GHG01878.1 DNA-binding transcriptional regulator CytR [Thalassotalea marina]
MSTIKKVCQLAGVSTATVSRALKNPSMVSEKTREKILKAIAESGYRPNVLASSIKTGKTNTIVVLVPNLSNPFFLKIIQGIEQAAQESGYSVLLGDTQGDPARENEYAGMVLSNRVDGIIHLDHSFPFSDNDAALAEAVPMVSVCERIVSDIKYPVIELDNYAACRALAKHLISYGHQKFAVIAGQIDSQIHRDRLGGITSVLAEENIAFNDDMIVGGEYSIEAGEKGVNILMSRHEKPTAIFCFNDDIAIGAIHEIKKHGLKVPGDISVVGFDDIKVSGYIDPPLTTIHQPASEMGRKAVEVVLKQIRKEVLKKDREIMQFQLVERESTGLAKNS